MILVLARVNFWTKFFHHLQMCNYNSIVLHDYYSLNLRFIKDVMFLPTTNPNLVLFLRDTKLLTPSHYPFKPHSLLDNINMTWIWRYLRKSNLHWHCVLKLWNVLPMHYMVLLCVYRLPVSGDTPLATSYQSPGSLVFLRQL